MRRITPILVLVLAVYVLYWAKAYPDAFGKVTPGHTATALAAGRSLAKAEVKSECRFLVYQPKSTDIPMPVPVQQETQQAPQKSREGEAQPTQQGAQQQQAQPPAREGEQQQYREKAEQQPVQPGPERTYGWGYAWWWWIVIAAIIIFFIIIFAAWGGWGGRGGRGGP